MADRIISTADLTAISSALRKVGDNIEVVGHEVGRVNNEIQATRREVSNLEQRMNQIYETVVLANQMQFSQTELVKINQEQVEKFGHYAQIRRHTTGILQAVLFDFHS